MGSIEEQLAGQIAVTDVIKPNAMEALETLKQMGLKTVMLTGDSTKTAEFVAKQVGVGQARRKFYQPTADIIADLQTGIM